MPNVFNLSEKVFNIDNLEALSIRDVAGQHLVELGKNDPKIVTVDADLSRSTRTTAFIKEFPERSFNIGIAEQCQVSFAAGLAQEGYKPIVATMAPFITMRACEQVRTDVCYSSLPVIFMGSYVGYSGGEAGATHCALEDCAIMGSIAGMTVLEPGDPWIVAKMLDAAFELGTPVYIRYGREAAEPIYREDEAYEIGKALIPRDGNDGAFIVSGSVVGTALAAAERLEEESGVNIRVVDMHTITPIDIDAVVSAAETGRIVCAQDHNIKGGLGYYVAAAMAEAGVSSKFKILGCPNRFVPLATTDFLYKENEYDVDGLIKNMKAFL